MIAKLETLYDCETRDAIWEMLHGGETRFSRWEMLHGGETMDSIRSPYTHVLAWYKVLSATVYVLEHTKGW